MRDRTIVIAFFGILVAVGLFVSGTILGLVLGLVVLLLVGIFVSLEPRKEQNEAGALVSEATVTLLVVAIALAIICALSKVREHFLPP